MDEFDVRILKVLCEKVRLAPDLNLRHLAQLTPGYVGVDLRFLVTKAGQICIKRSVYFALLAVYCNSIVLYVFAKVADLLYHILLVDFYSSVLSWCLTVCHLGYCSSRSVLTQLQLMMLKIQLAQICRPTAAVGCHQIMPVDCQTVAMLLASLLLP